MASRIKWHTSSTFRRTDLCDAIQEGGQSPSIGLARKRPWGHLAFDARKVSPSLSSAGLRAYGFSTKSARQRLRYLSAATCPVISSSPL